MGSPYDGLPIFIRSLCYFRPHRMGSVRRTAIFNPHRVGNRYDGQRFLFAVYVTFAPHRMGVRTTDGDIYLLL